MNDNDDLNDSTVLSAVRDSISGWPMQAAPRLEGITARASRCPAAPPGWAVHCRRRGVRRAGRRPRRRLGLRRASATGRAGVTARRAPGPSGGVLGRRRPRRHHDADPVPGAGGQPRRYLHRALAEHGIPALVTAGKFCRTAAQPAPGVGDVVVLPGGELQPAGHGQGPGPIVIYGSRIPSGVELSIGYHRQDSQDKEISFSLIQAGAPLQLHQHSR